MGTNTHLFQNLSINNTQLIMTQKKKAPKQEVDESTIKLLTLYRKRCDSNGMQQVKSIRDRIEAAIEDGKLENLQLLDELGPIGVRAMMEAFSDISYRHLKKLKLWKVRTEDEGVRSICNFIDKTHTLTQLDLLDNEITPLGCQFIGKTLTHPNCSLIKLKLSHNNFGSEGLKNMANGLAINSSLQKLNVKYCQIDSYGIKYIQQMLANINSRMLSLKLQGNPLGNDGLYELLRALSYNDTLQKINISDIQINMLETVKKSESQKQTEQKLLEVIQKNKSIWKWDLKFNLFTDNLASAILASVGINDTILKLELPETVSIEIRELLANAVKKRKPKKKGKKANKGKSKKK